MGLIARAIETAGIPTLCMTSAWSITRETNAPRAAYLDFPLGHTTGKPNDAAGQRAILSGALAKFETFKEPGSIEQLPQVWSEDDAWKEDVMRPVDPSSQSESDASGDDRTKRYATPQYQTPKDRALAEAALASDGCPSCVFIEDEIR